jgi:hypothetical protein
MLGGIFGQAGAWGGIANDWVAASTHPAPCLKPLPGPQSFICLDKHMLCGVY